MPSTFAQLHIAPILPAFLAAHPDVALELRPPDVPFDLIGSSFDLALRNSALDDSNPTARKLADDSRLAKGKLILDDGQARKLQLWQGGISITSLWSVYREIAEGSLIRVLPEYGISNKTAIWLVYPKSNVL